MNWKYEKEIKKLKNLNEFFYKFFLHFISKTENKLQTFLFSFRILEAFCSCFGMISATEIGREKNEFSSLNCKIHLSSQVTRIFPNKCDIISMVVKKCRLQGEVQLKVDILHKIKVPVNEREGERK